jgi:hypothetical protein
MATYHPGERAGSLPIGCTVVPAGVSLRQSVGVPRGVPTPPERKREVMRLHRAGCTQSEIGRRVGLDRGTVKAIVNGVAANNGQEWVAARSDVVVPGPRRPDQWCSEAVVALGDRSGFLFCKRYFGIELSPWQRVSWETMEDLWDSVDREFLCENAAPGLGKSTVKVAFAAKRIVVDRAVRVLFISRAQSLAERNTMRLRRALERTSPAVGALATLSGDFGRFKPSGAGDVWRKHEFVVEQSDGTPIEEKEPTVSSFGFDAEWLGNRLDLMFGDDLDSTRSIRNFETVQVNRQIFDDELEPRLEGGGLMAITQQRLGPFDFSSHALSKQVLFDDDGVSDEVDSEPQYRHLVFKAHYDDRCRGIETHRPDAPPWPEGCLLDPRRLTWRDIRKAMNSRRRFAVVYQQEEADESDALVPRLWVDGGRGTDGVDYPGCWDKNRGLAEVPEGLVAPNLSVVTCDPSPTRFWSIQWWLVNAPTEQRFLLDLVRQAMDAPDFLDFDMNEGRFTGLLEEWWQRSADMGSPFSHLIVEANAAQRFMLQYDLFRKWATQRKVLVIPHQTHRNKSDPEFGVQSLASLYKFGRVRLPGRQGADPGRVASMKLVDEVTRWPQGATDDCVMAEWFLEWNLPNLTGSVSGKSQRRHVPSWMRRPA